MSHAFPDTWLGQRARSAVFPTPPRPPGPGGSAKVSWLWPSATVGGPKVPCFRAWGPTGWAKPSRFDARPADRRVHNAVFFSVCRSRGWQTRAFPNTWLGQRAQSAVFSAPCARLARANGPKRRVFDHLPRPNGPKCSVSGPWALPGEPKRRVLTPFAGSVGPKCRVFPHFAGPGSPKPRVSEPLARPACSKPRVFGPLRPPHPDKWPKVQ